MTDASRGKGRVYATLDGLRGVAAVVVAIRHTSFFHGLDAHGGYMAVDLFFVLSGFVIAHAYQDRLAGGLSASRFLALRYLRLWPVYLIGALLGLAAAFCQVVPNYQSLTPMETLRTAPFALAMLPGPIVMLSIYPVNSVAWSLFLELIANLAYALWWRQLRRPPVLAAVLAGSAAILIASTCWYGRLDVGFTWLNVLGGLPRVIFSFTAGVALYRVFETKATRLRIPPWALLLVLPPLFWARTDPIVYPLVCVLAVFPFLVFAAASSEPGPGSARIFARLGALSYPLYALHEPVGHWATYGLSVTAPRMAHWGVLFGAPYLVVLLFICGLVDRYYDRPVRRALTERFVQAFDRYSSPPCVVGHQPS